jgi:hypothetical protein
VRSTAIQRFAVPLTVGWLGLPAEAATAFVMGFVRRDFGAAGFFTMNLTAAQLLVSMVTITLFVPCIASVMVIWKERGAGYVVGLFAARSGLAFIVAASSRGSSGWRRMRLTDCPTCGFAAEELRCPRCNALKVTSCSGGCTTCRTSGCGSREPARTASSGCCGSGEAAKRS